MNRAMTVAEAQAWIEKTWDDAQKASWQATVNAEKQRADELAKAYENGWNAAMAKRLEPLTEEELDELAMDEDGLPNSHIEFARAIERAHNIT